MPPRPCNPTAECPAWRFLPPLFQFPAVALIRPGWAQSVGRMGGSYWAGGGGRNTPPPPSRRYRRGGGGYCKGRGGGGGQARDTEVLQHGVLGDPGWVRDRVELRSARHDLDCRVGRRNPTSLSPLLFVSRLRGTMYVSILYQRDECIPGRRGRIRESAGSQQSLVGERGGRLVIQCPSLLF
jgi:hypothetical protein